MHRKSVAGRRMGASLRPPAGLRARGEQGQQCHPALSLAVALVESGAELIQPGLEAPADRAGRDARHRGDLRGRTIFEVAQRHGLAVGLGQVGHQFRQQAVDLQAGQRLSASASRLSSDAVGRCCVRG